MTSLLAALLASLALIAAPQSRPPQLHLPTGPLKAFSENDKSVHFFDQGSVWREGGRAGMQTYTVFHEGWPSGGRVIVHWTTEFRVDCPRRTVQQLRLSAYDEVGDEVLWLPPEAAEPVRSGTLQDQVHQTLCETSPTFPHRPLTGWREALAFGRAHLGV